MIAGGQSLVAMMNLRGSSPGLLSMAFSCSFIVVSAILATLRLVGTASSTAFCRTVCCTTVCTSTTGLSPDTVTVSCSVAT